MRLGSLRNSDAKLYSDNQLQWSSGPIKILGIQFHNDKQQMLEVNYTNIIQKIDNLFKSWDNRDLSLWGRIIVINTLAISQLIYKMLMINSLNNIYLLEIQKLIK